MKLTLRYQQMSNRQRIAIPLAISAVLLAFLLTSGVHLGRDLGGGSLVMVQGVENLPPAGDLESAVEGLLGTDVDVTLAENGFHIETDTLSETQITSLRGMLSAQFGIPINLVTVGETGPAITKAQGEQVWFAIIGAFVGAGIISFFIFRRLVAPLTIISVLALDIFGVLGYMALFNVPLDMASIVGIAMLIVYATNTNVLLAWRALKRATGEAKAQVLGSLNTGITMDALVVVLLLSLNILTSAHEINVLTAVLIFGIVINIINTWLLGAGILLRHLERRKVVGYHVTL